MMHFFAKLYHYSRDYHFNDAIKWFIENIKNRLKQFQKKSAKFTKSKQLKFEITFFFKERCCFLIFILSLLFDYTN